VKTHVTRMLRAMAWADEQVLAAINDSPHAPSDALKLLAHLLAAEHVWLARLRQQEPTHPVWPQLDMAACKSLAVDNALGYSDFVAGLSDDGLAAPIRYRNAKGDEFVNSVIDILTQVVTHGAYHRGQIAKALGGAGVPAVSTDFITYVRSVEPAGA
jgi:uncharacterized damage-inducible protein DinB